MRVNLSVAIVSMVNQTAIPHAEDNDTSDVCPKTKPINGTFIPVNLLFSLSGLNLNYYFFYIITLDIYHITSYIILLFKYIYIYISFLLLR